MPRGKLIILHPIDEGRNLSHSRLTGYHSQREVWSELIGNNTVEALRVDMKGQVFDLNVTNYINRGGIESAEIRQWLEDRKLTDGHNELLFEVTYNEQDHSMNYVFKGIVSKHSVIQL